MMVKLNCTYTNVSVSVCPPGFPVTLEIRETHENDFPIFQLAKTQGNWEKHNKSGTTQGICDSDPEGKGLRQFGVCVSCAMCPSCVH